MHTDILIIGSGVSGLSFALKTASSRPEIKITIVTKADKDESNTKYAQGGVAVVTDFKKDSFEKHIADTLRAGDGVCNPQTVEIVVKEGPERIKEMAQWGADFDKSDSDCYDLGREGGHTENRVLHHKDVTGAEIERALLKAIEKQPNVQMYNYHYAIDLITDQSQTCQGAYILDLKGGQVIKISSKITLLATGGCGHVYKNTTNPVIATGDGIGLAHRAKARISNMQYIQFHPTAFYSPKSGQLPLISEAVRGFGAKLRTKSGEPFMYKYDEREELASRDIVARAIDNEMHLHGDAYVCLDCRHLDQQSFMRHFPNIYKQCKDEGFDMFNDLIPVVPASHYLCGGIDVDQYGQTSVKNLFAVGECSNTGLHGANRLASNSLLEALVYAHRAAMRSIDLFEEKDFNNNEINTLPGSEYANNNHVPQSEPIEDLQIELQIMMSDLVSIVRTNDRLKKAKEKVQEIDRKVRNIYQNSVVSRELQELRNLVSVAELIISQSIEQKENRGAFYNKDLDFNAKTIIRN